MLVKINNLSKKYNDKHVLKDISFSFSNEIVGLLGHSGAGKTTLLKILSRLENYDEGNISIDNKDLKDSPINIGIQLQNQDLINHLTVFDYISFMIKRVKVKINEANSFKKIYDEIKLIKEQKLIPTIKYNNKDIKSLYIELIEKNNITPYATNLYLKSKVNMEKINKKLSLIESKIKGENERYFSEYEIEKEVITISKMCFSTPLLFKKPKELSLGETQRVKISIALIKRPSLLLLDEATSNLDPQLKKEIILSIKNVFKQMNIPIIYVTHSFEEAKQLCSKLLFLKDGKVEQFDSLTNIKSKPVSSYIKEYIK